MVLGYDLCNKSETEAFTREPLEDINQAIEKDGVQVMGTVKVLIYV